MNERPLIAIEAEFGVLGALMKKPELCEVVGAFLSPTDFSQADNGILYTMVLRCRSKGIIPDPLSLAEYRAELPSGEMTLAYATEIWQNVVSAANAESYARTVAERAKARALYATGELIMEIAQQRGSLPEQIAEAQNAVLGLNSEDDEPDVITLCEALGPVVDEMDARFNGEGLNGLTTGLDDLDDLLKGLRPQNVIIIAGRPGTGKTTLGLGIAEHLAIRDRKSALIFSLEMSGKELGKRSLASCSEVSLGNIDTGKAIGEGEEVMRITSAVSRMSTADLRICQKGGLPLSRIRNIARFQHKAKPLDLIVIDYIGLIAPEPNVRQQNRNLELGAISRGIKAMAKELNLPIVVLAQLNRSIETRSNKCPQMSDLRDSGEIEQDADVIMIAHRDPESDMGRAGVTEIHVPKHRHAPTGMCLLQHQGQFARFVNFAGQREQQQAVAQARPSAKSMIADFKPRGVQ